MALSPNNPHKKGSIAYRRWEAAWKRIEKGKEPLTQEHQTQAFREQQAPIQGGRFDSPTPTGENITIISPGGSVFGPDHNIISEGFGLDNGFSFEFFRKEYKRRGFDQLFRAFQDSPKDFTPIDQVERTVQKRTLLS